MGVKSHIKRGGGLLNFFSLIVIQPSSTLAASTCQCKGSSTKPNQSWLPIEVAKIPVEPTRKASVEPLSATTPTTPVGTRDAATPTKPGDGVARGAFTGENTGDTSKLAEGEGGTCAAT
jgi:hypothetical protein